MKKQFETFKDFYAFYLSQHRLPVTKGLHIIGLILVFSLLVYVIAARHWLMLFALPVLGYAPAWIGHFFFEKNRPATFQYPLYSLMGDFVMLKDTLFHSKSMQR